MLLARLLIFNLHHSDKSGVAEELAIKESFEFYGCQLIILNIFTVGLCLFVERINILDAPNWLIIAFLESARVSPFPMSKIVISADASRGDFLATFARSFVNF
jgi:hypothetical protein